MAKINKSWYKSWWIITLLIVVVMIFIASHFFIDTSNKSRSENNQNLYNNIAENILNSVSCGDNDTLFNVMPIPLDEIFKITPLGSVSPPDHVFPPPHLYMYVIDFNNPKENNAQVYAPGNLTLTQIGIRHYKKLNNQENYTDYTLVFSRCSKVEIYFHHVTSLVYQPFIDAANSIEKNCQFGGFKNEEYCSGQVHIPINEGAQIGTSGDLKAGVYGLDMGVRDYRILNGKDFVNANRICGENKNVFSHCYAVCPFDYFPGYIQDKVIYSDITPHSSSKEKLSCGTVYTDVENTAQGYWFAKNSGKDQPGYSSEAFNLYLGPDSTKPSVNIFSIGYSLPNLNPGKYEFIPQNSGNVNRIFSEVKNDGKVYCYELHSREDPQRSLGSVLIQLEDNTTLKLNRISGKECSGNYQFDSNTVEFIR